MRTPERWNPIRPIPGARWGAALALTVLLAGTASWIEESDAAPAEVTWYVSGTPWHLTLWAVQDDRPVSVWRCDLGRAKPPETAPAGGVAAVEGEGLIFVRPVPTPLPGEHAAVRKPHTAPIPVGIVEWDESQQAYAVTEDTALTLWYLEDGLPVGAMHLNTEAEGEPREGAMPVLELPVVYAPAPEGTEMHLPDCPGCRAELEPETFPAPTPTPPPTAVPPQSCG